MPDEPAFHPTVPITLNAESTTVPSIVPVAPSLTPREIERVCKVFIRLISAPEKESINDDKQPKARKATRHATKQSSDLQQTGRRDAAGTPTATDP